MDTKFLDLSELVLENKKKEKYKLDMFLEVLSKCHTTIKRKNKVGQKHMEYIVPTFIPGKPCFDKDALRTYLVKNLKSNGLYVRELNHSKLFISWDETLLDLKQFEQSKEEFLRKYNEDMVTDDHGIIEVTPRLMAMRQKKQRAQRFKMQESRKKPPSVSYMEYLNGKRL